MAQVAQQDPSTTAPKEPALPVDDTTLTQPLVSERIVTYQQLRAESLPYPTHQFVDRSHSAKQPTRIMQSSHPPEDPHDPPPQSQLDRDRFSTSSSLRSSNPSSVEHPPPKPDTAATKTAPLTEQDPGGRVDDPQTTSSLYREGPATTGDFVATTSIPGVDDVRTSSDAHVPEPDPATAESAGTESVESAQPHASPDEASDSTHGEYQADHIHPESSEASPRQSVPLDQFPPNHGVYNMVASFNEMSINPMQYGTSVPMIPMQPHPLSFSPQQAAHVAHHQRQQQMFQHQQHPQTHFLWVPQERVGAVIGGHGAVIRSLQERSGATIQVHNDTVRGDHKLFTIFGTSAQYEAAAQLVNEIVERPRPSTHGGSSVSSERSHFSALGDHTSRVTEMCKTVYVPSRCVGLVIGRNGETIRNLQDKSGAIIKVTRNEEAAPGAENRSILISGTEEAISHAHRLVSEIVSEARARRSPHLNSPMGPGLSGQPHVVEMLAIPNDKVGLIIGKKGATIRDLQMRSGAKIQVTKDDNCLQNDGSRPVTITGMRSNVDEAKAMIASKINIPMLSAIPATAAFPGGARPATIPPQPAGQAVPYIFSSHVYEPGFQNGQESFPQIFEAGDPNNQGRAAMAYFQYMGYNNYPAMGQHARSFQHPVPMHYSHAQQAIQEQQGIQVPPSDQQDPNVQAPFHSPSVKPGQPMELPQSPTMLSRDANGGIVMYQGNPFPQLAQMPPHQMFPTPPNSRMFSHREQAHAAHVQAQAQLFAQAQAQAQAQATQTQAASSSAQTQATSQTQAQVQAQVGSDQPTQARSLDAETRNQQGRAPEGEQSSS